MSAQPVCPYCVQWRCRKHPTGGCAIESPCYSEDFEPYWANGEVAVLTQQTPCSECQTSLDAMHASR